jgi:hypothetical protein
MVGPADGAPLFGDCFVWGAYVCEGILGSRDEVPSLAVSRVEFELALLRLKACLFEACFLGLVD